MTRTRLLLLALGLALGSSCGRYESCDPGQTLQFNVCFPGAGDAAPAPDAGMTAQEGGTAPPSDAMMEPDADPSCPVPPANACTDKFAGFGDGCGATSQCRCRTDLCAVIPGQTCGFCTRSGCMANPGICPPGWSCYDASAYQPGYSLCVHL